MKLIEMTFVCKQTAVLVVRFSVLNSLTYLTTMLCVGSL